MVRAVSEGMVEDVAGAFIVANPDAERAAGLRIEHSHPQPAIVPAPEQPNLEAICDAGVQFSYRCEDFGCHAVLPDCGSTGPAVFHGARAPPSGECAACRGLSGMSLCGFSEDRASAATEEVAERLFGGPLGSGARRNR